MTTPTRRQHESRTKVAAKRVETPGKALEERPNAKLILLAEVADFLNESLPGEYPPIASHTPYDWWKRHKQGRLSAPMPKEVRMVGMGPMFRATDILKWYINYQMVKKSR